MSWIWSLLAYTVAIWALMLWSMWRRHDIPKDRRVLAGLIVVGPILVPWYFTHYAYRKPANSGNPPL